VNRHILNSVVTCKNMVCPAQVFLTVIFIIMLISRRGKGRGEANSGKRRMIQTVYVPFSNNKLCTKFGESIFPRFKKVRRFLNI